MIGKLSELTEVGLGVEITSVIREFNDTMGSSNPRPIGFLLNVKVWIDWNIVTRDRPRLRMWFLVRIKINQTSHKDIDIKVVSAKSSGKKMYMMINEMTSRNTAGEQVVAMEF